MMWNNARNHPDVIKAIALAAAVAMVGAVGPLAAVTPGDPIADVPAEAAVMSPGGPVKLPDTPAARHAAAWLVAFNAGDDAGLRAMLEEHLAAGARVTRSIDERIVSMRQMKEREGTLTVMRVVQADENFVRLVVRNATGAFLQLDFECEPVDPHGVQRVMVAMVPDPEAVAPRPPAISAADLPSYFDEYLSARARADEFSGVVLVAKDGAPVFRKAYGTADRRFDVPNRLDTRFNMGSIGKLLTKTAIAQLSEAGRLRLDDRLERWLPGWPSESGSKITVEHLVNFRSGVPDFLNEPDLKRRFFAADRSQLRHNRDFIPFFRDEPLLFEPGTSERYSNSGYVLLGEIIERASGRDYYDYLRERVLIPAGMTDTDWAEADDPEDNTARGYFRSEGGTGPLRENTILLWPRGFAAGGGQTTVDDLLRLEQALREAKLVSPAWSLWVLAPDVPPPPASVDQPMPTRYVLMGGAEGITASLAHNGAWTLVLLSNLDRGIMGKVEEHLLDCLSAIREQEGAP
jgi:CubicO group peptidase (beta-lactamase class C family)